MGRDGGVKEGGVGAFNGKEEGDGRACMWTWMGKAVTL